MNRKKEYLRAFRFKLQIKLIYHYGGIAYVFESE